MVLESLHHMLLPMLQWDKEGVQASSSEFPVHHYTSRQCTALETMLDILRVCLYLVASKYISKTVNISISSFCLVYNT